MMSQKPKNNYAVSWYGLIGTGFEDIWWTNCKCRYRLLKGARSSKKSYDFMGLEVINKIISDKRRNVVIIRKTMASNRDSTWARLIKLINQPSYLNPELSFRKYFNFNKTDMTITYIPTGQVILFKGFDDAYKLTSMEVPFGYLTDVYIEEAFEIDDYNEFSKFDQSIRGKLPDGLFHQITLCFNAWEKDHWLYEKFFKGRLEDDYEYLEQHSYQEFIDENLIIEFGKGLALHTSTFRINEFRDAEIYDLAMEQLKDASVDRYKTIALGMRGQMGDVVYNEFRESKNVITPQEANTQRFSCYAIGLDVGLSDGQGKIVYDKERHVKSATTMSLCALTYDYSKVIVLDEYYYANNQTDKKTSTQIQMECIDKIKQWEDFYKLNNDTLFRTGTIPIYVDNADINFRDTLQHIAKSKGYTHFVFMPCTKRKIATRVDFENLLFAFGELLISDKCKNLIREIKSSRRDDTGKPRPDGNDHSLNCFEYSFESFIIKLRRWKNYKEH